MKIRPGWTRAAGIRGIPAGVAVVIRPARSVRGLRILRRLPSGGRGFLTLERLVAKNLYHDGERSPVYRFEVVHRRGGGEVGGPPFYFEAPQRLLCNCKVRFLPGADTAR